MLAQATLQTLTSGSAVWQQGIPELVRKISAVGRPASRHPCLRGPVSRALRPRACVAVFGLHFSGHGCACGGQKLCVHRAVLLTAKGSWRKVPLSGSRWSPPMMKASGLGAGAAEENWAHTCSSRFQTSSCVGTGRRSQSSFHPRRCSQLHMLGPAPKPNFSGRQSSLCEVASELLPAWVQ